MPVRFGRELFRKSARENHLPELPWGSRLAGSVRREEGKTVAAIRRRDKIAPSRPRPLPGGVGPGTVGSLRTGGGPMPVAFPRLLAPLTAALLLAAVASLRATDFEKKSEIGFGAGA